MIAFADAMRDAGIDPPAEIVADGRMHRFDVPGDGPKKKNGWYVLFDDPFAGAFGCWKRGIKETWCGAKEASQEEREEFKRRVSEERRARKVKEEKEKEECRAKAKRIWDQAKTVAEHPYLVRKGVKGYRARMYNGSLVVPVQDAKGLLHGLQFIGADGVKKFLTGTAKSGCYFSIGRPKGVLCIAEGFATGASVHECTGHAVAVAFDAGNLLPVGQVLREKFPSEIIVFCADNDKSGVGQEKAAVAAKECRGVVVMPPELGLDFNDYHQKHGAQKVRELF